MSGSDHLDADLAALVLRAADARAIASTQIVQELWSGYGQIVRCRLRGGPRASVIVKLVRWPDGHDHPRGWDSDRSHERKLESYRVETTWYERYAQDCPDACRVPRLLASETRAGDVVIVMEDLDAEGFDGRRQRLSRAELDACVSWLASFHATFMGTRPEGLWSEGTYWHLATRPDELAALEDEALAQAAPLIDRLLSDSPFQTLVHGDAKVANFCFDARGGRVAAVDFQYVGGGCGMKDLAYFMGSCLDAEECDRLAPDLLDRYFELLAASLAARDTSVDVTALEEDWRALYPVAWADFARFLHGWSPDHWKLHAYSQRLTREVVGSL